MILPPVEGLTRAGFFSVRLGWSEMVVLCAACILGSRGDAYFWGEVGVVEALSGFAGRPTAGAAIPPYSSTISRTFGPLGTGGPLSEV